MLAIHWGHGPRNLSFLFRGKADGYAFVEVSGVIGCRTSKNRRRSRAAECGSRNGDVKRSVVARDRLTNLLLSRIELDSKALQTDDPSQLLRVGPLPGDIAEVEAYCRIIRAAEHFHTSLMETLCNSGSGECSSSVETFFEDINLLKEEVFAALGCMLALLNRGRNEVLFGRSSFVKSFQAAVINAEDGKLPPFVLYRGEMKRCCESLEVALANYFKPFEDYKSVIWRQLQRLKNVCYDTGFSRRDEYPCPTVFANWAPVFFTEKKEGIMLDKYEVAFWRGGQVTDEGLAWLLVEGFKTIVDLREEACMDEYYCSAMERAVSSGKIEVIKLPIKTGTAPSMEQVEQFFLLASDPRRKPIYLHSQEGVNRTSDMISKWKLCIAAAEKNSVDKNSVANNDQPIKTVNNLEDKHLMTLMSQVAQGCNILDAQNDCRLTAVDLLTEKLTSQDVSTCSKKNQIEKITPNLISMHNSVSSYGADAQTSLFYFLKNNPLKAQFPKCNIFSRKGMSQFFLSRKISPETYLSSCMRKYNDASVSLKITDQSFQFRESANACIPQWMQQSLHGQPKNRIFEFGAKHSVLGNGKHLENEYLSSLKLGVDGYNDEKCYGVTVNESKGIINKSNFCGLTLPALKDTKSRDNDMVTISSASGCMDHMEVNMSSSAAGIVRVQSRKKAEIFFVNTDGITFTSEKLTESSLAFTHPSTQQQILIWKVPPKTVLLLKKLGQELMGEAKEGINTAELQNESVL